MMNNAFNNPYMNSMPNPYISNTYMPSSYSPQGRIQALEQQKRDIDSQISMLQSQTNQSPLPQININNQIPTTPTSQQNVNPMGMNQGQQQFDFSGKFIKNESELEETFNNNLPVILMSSEDNKFYIKNMDGSITKYKFEELKEDPKQSVETNNQEVQMLRKQVEEQGIALSQILAYMQGVNQQSSINNQPIQNNAQNSNIERIQDVENVEPKKILEANKTTTPSANATSTPTTRTRATKSTTSASKSTKSTKTSVEK